MSFFPERVLMMRIEEGTIVYGTAFHAPALLVWAVADTTSFGAGWCCGELDLAWIWPASSVSRSRLHCPALQSWVKSLL